MRRALRWLGLVLVVALAFGVGISWPVLVRPPLVVGQDAITDAASARVTPVLETAGGRNTLVAQPPSGTTAIGQRLLTGCGYYLPVRSWSRSTGRCTPSSVATVRRPATVFPGLAARRPRPRSWLAWKLSSPPPSLV